MWGGGVDKKKKMPEELNLHKPLNGLCMYQSPF